MRFIIPSYNRACQLHLFFESILRNFEDNQNLGFTVIYRATDDKFKEGYERTKKSFPSLDIRWVEQTDFQRNVLNFLAGEGDGLIGWAVDDIIFYRRFNGLVSTIASLFTEDVWAHSFRLGLNTVIQNYATGELQEELQVKGYIPINSYVKYNWKVHPPYSNYGYFASLDMTVYRAKDFLKACEGKEWDNPRALESVIANNHELRRSIDRRHLTCGIYGHTFVNTVNCVQDTKIDAGLQFPYSIEDLNEKYLSGFVMDLDKFEWSPYLNAGCHGETEIFWRKTDDQCRCAK